MPVIIRRPHAYEFLVQSHEDRIRDASDVHGSETGLEIGGLELPIPGFYVLDPEGKVLARTGLASVEDVLAVLRDHARR